MQRVEVRNAVDTEDHGFAVDHKLTDAVFQGGLTDPREAARPVTAGDQPHAVAVALQPDAVAVIFDFVKPPRTGGNLCTLDRKAELKRLKHASKIGGASGNVNPAA
jgi:hypothetical protein